MNRYSGVREKVKLPQSLSNPSVLAGILNTTKKIIDQVQIQNQFSRNLHSILQHLSQAIQKSSSQSESKFNSTSGSNSLVCKQVVKILYIMFRHLEQQAFKNQITLKTISKTERDQPLYKSISDKCDKIKQKTEEYIKLYTHYETAELTYIEKTEKFENVESNPIKYFSVDISSDKISRIKEIQAQLQRTLERLKLEQVSLQNMYKQIRKLLAELMYTKIKRMYETITLSREVVVKMMTFEDIIIQQGSKDYLTNFSDQSPDDYTFTSTEQAIVMAKKMLEKERTIRYFLEQYILSIKRSVQQYKRQLLGLESTALGSNLNRQKRYIENKIGTNLYYDKIQSNEQIQKFCGFLQKLVSKVQIDKTIHKYRKAEDQTIQKLQAEIKTLVKLEINKDQQQKLKSYADMKHRLEKKYRQQFQSINSNFKQDVLVLIKMLKELRQGFLNQFKPYQKPEQDKIQQQVNEILLSQQYKILSQPFLISNEQFIFLRSPYIDTFLKNKNQDVVENIQVDLDSSDRNSQAIRNVLFNKTLCCGNGSNDKQIIDQFNCALVNKMLLQGKLVLYKKLIKFTSIFNRSTFLGKTKIKIPIKDIVNIDKDNNFINGIFIQTTHGILRFSSFLTNPIPVLKYYYINIKGNARGMMTQPQLIRYDQRSSIQPTQYIGHSPQIYTSGVFRTSFANKMVQQGFIEKSVNQMYRTKNNGNKRVLEVVKYKQNENQTLIDVEYSIQGKGKQNYHCQIKTTKQGKVNSQYQFSETTKIFQQDFVQLMRVFMNKPQKRNAHLSPNFSISSIAFDNQNIGQTHYQKQPNTFINTMTPVQTIRMPNSDNSIIQSPPQTPYHSRIFSTSHVSALPKKSIIHQSKQVRKQQGNPIVLYIIIGMIVFALAIII